MTGVTTSNRSMLAASAIAGLAFFLLGYACIWLSRATHDVAIIWVATAFAICFVLRNSHSWREDAWIMAGVFAGGVLANSLGGSSPLVSALFSLINVASVTTARIMTLRHPVRRFLNVLDGLKFFLLAGIIPSFVGAALAALVLLATGSVDVMFEARSWLYANLLGFLIVAPLGMTISLREIRKLKLAERKFEVALTFAILLVLTVYIYTVPPVSPLFLIVPVGIWMSFRFRLIGANAAIILISVAAFIAHAMGMGPSRVVEEPRASYALQLFLIVCVTAFVPLALFLNERDFHIALIDRRRQRATQANKFKNQLLTHVSHEVRNPLQAIIGFSSMLESGLLKPDKAPEFARLIASNGELLMRLHEDLLDFARAESGALTLTREKINAAHALADAIQRSTPLTGDNSVHSLVMDNVDTDLALSADPLRLAQILNNLIDNAKKYSFEASPVLISARRLDDRYGRIEIVNYGPGIKPDHRGLVFQPFNRLGARGGNGAGLGLSITKMLVEVHGGRIDFESTPNESTRFWVDLPLAA